MPLPSLLPLAAGTWIAIGIAVVVGFWVVAAYNGLVRLKVICKEAWAQIDVQLKRRHDLIPNLVETAKGYLKHERETLERVIAARNTAVAAREDPKQGVAQVAAAEGALTGMLRQLAVVVEAYPDLKADASMARVQEELASTENRIAFARQHYNDSVRRYNTKLEQVPTNLVKNLGDFPPQEFFEIDDPVQREAPRVQF
jgi:LemA protein